LEAAHLGTIVSVVSSAAKLVGSFALQTPAVSVLEEGHATVMHRSPKVRRARVVVQVEEVRHLLSLLVSGSTYLKRPMEQ
jgi:hypothetical protein